MLVDIEMSQTAKREGFNTALLSRATEDFVKITEGMPATIGRQAFLNQTDGQPGPTTVQWWPVGVRVASSGDLGYTWGNWKWTTRDTVYHGNYFSAWRKTEEGKWQLILDGGNTTPP